MVLIRLIEEELFQAVNDGRLTGSTHLCIGQEAVPVGACAALGEDDPVIATYRGHGWALARGVPPEQLIGEIFGRDSELNGGRGGSAYLSAPQYGFYGENSIVGAGVPVALGLAIACARIHRDRVPLVSIGDGAMNQGNVHESLNMASVLNIPIIIVVENNGYVEMTPSDELTAVPAARRAEAHRIAAHEVDGNDPEAVRQVVSDARAEALATSRPVLVEAHTRRLGGHYSGDAQQYRPAGELEAWKLTDPLVQARQKLSDDVAALSEAGAAAALAAAVAFAEQMPLPDPTEVMSHVFAG
jgi:TPP-dependent pyruvate/acetoin dehydrogenase alpha subunit